jgi:PAS domain S-box-containing protein
MSKEIFFGDDEFIISKTDIKGVITYGNELFRKMSGYSEEEYIGQPHNILRHPEMPASIFKLLWETVSNKKEIFALVNNKAKNGDYYWVMAHVTPSYGENEKIIGYHSVRRRPSD